MSGIASSGKPVVQFASQIMYADEDDAVQIEVMRIGALGEACKVEYMAEGDTLKLEGQKFKRCQGVLEFGPNESTKCFTLELLEEKMFDSVVELHFGLVAVENCEVGALHKTRLKIIDDDVFPSTRFANDILRDPTTDSWKQDNDWGMLWEFIKLAYSINRWGATKMLIGDQINNIIFIVQLEVNRQLINALSDSGSASHNQESVIKFALIMTLPYAVSHFFSYSKQFWKVGGMVRKEVLKDLMMRILYYDEATRDHVHATEVKETFAHHVFEIVGKGYMQIFPICAASGRILMLLIYFIYRANEDPRKEDEPGQFYFLICFAVIPVGACVYMRLRIRQTTKVREEMEDAKIELVNYMDGVIDNYRVIADSWARPQVMSKCGEKINRVNKMLVMQGARQANDVAFFGWATELVEAFVIIVGGFLVLSGMQLGAFTSTMAGLRGATGQYAVLYKAALNMQSTFPCLWLLVQYMNLPMDLESRKANAQRQRQAWPAHLASARLDERVVKGERVAEDVMPIEVKNVRYRFPVNVLEKLSSSNLVTAASSTREKRKSGRSPKTDEVLNGISMKIEQGQLIAVTGRPGHGKGTLLRVLAEVLLPTSGEVFVPSHLRVQHVELQESLYQGSLAENVYFGLMALRGTERVADLSEEDLQRGVEVCQALNMMPEIVAAVRDHGANQGCALKGLSRTTRVRVQLARALIANPEVLVLQLPVDFLLTATGADAAMQALQDFVKYRGLALPNHPMDVASRRPRTCIFSSNHAAVLEQAHKVYSVMDGQLYEGMLEGATRTAWVEESMADVANVPGGLTDVSFSLEEVTEPGDQVGPFTPVLPGLA